MTEPPAAEGSADDNAEETLRLANKWDPSEVKRVLDEFSAQARTRPLSSSAPRAVRSCTAAHTQVVLDAGYEEDMFVSNTKIGAPPAPLHAVAICASDSSSSRVTTTRAPPAPGLGLLTCATALLAQFYPLSFPQNYTLLVACVVMYFVLNTALQVCSQASACCCFPLCVLLRANSRRICHDTLGDRRSCTCGRET
jgi:hypothetical protein